VTLPDTTETNLPSAERNQARAYAAASWSGRTWKAYRAGWTRFTEWCAGHGVAPLPAPPETVASYLAVTAQTHKPATVQLHASAIAAVHRHDGHPNPCEAQAVRDVLHGIVRAHGGQQAQDRGLTSHDVARIEVAIGDGARDKRDFAMLVTARDLMARRSELAALDVTDLGFDAADGSGTATIRRSKTDQSGEGHTGYLSPPAVQALYAYMRAYEVEDGPLFRSRPGGGRISELGVARAFKRLAERAGIDPATVSGHSARIGMAQDLAAYGVSTVEMMHAGRWSSERMPARYTQKQAAKRSAIARFHGMR